MISVIKFDSFFVLVDNQNQQPLYEQLLLYYRVLVAPSDLQLGLLVSPRNVKLLFVIIFPLLPHYLSSTTACTTIIIIFPSTLYQCYRSAHFIQNTLPTFIIVSLILFSAST